MLSWVRYFGSMDTMAFDQEGAVTSDMVASACDKLFIARDLGGSQEDILLKLYTRLLFKLSRLS